VVSITRLRVRSWRYLLPFIFYALRSSRQAKNTHGNIAVSLLRDTGNTYWTRTVWTTESAMKTFMRARPHGQVMRRLLEWCDEAARSGVNASNSASTANRSLPDTSIARVQPKPVRLSVMGYNLGEPLAAGAAEADRQLVGDEFAATAGEDRRSSDQACAALLAAGSL